MLYLQCDGETVLWYSYVQYDAVIDVIGDILGFIINDASMVQTSILI